MKTKSFVRREEYKHISRLHIDGEIIDIGGSKKSGYHELIGGNHKIITCNIDASYGADMIFDAQTTWPFKNERFDCVLLVNVLEHIFDYKKVVDESFRVLKNGGRVAGVVPFMFNVHGSPSDYFRYTKHALEKIFTNAGYKSVVVEELGSGAFGVIYHALIGFMRFNWMATFFIFICRGLDKIVSSIKPNNKMSSKYMPLGYYFEAKK
jgi:SAM-dependent methyltransferase